MLAILILFFFGNSTIISLNDRINSITSKGRHAEQIIELKKLIPEASKYQDTLGLLYYRIGFRYHSNEVGKTDLAFQYFIKAEKLLTIKNCDNKLSATKFKLVECYGKKNQRDKQIEKLGEIFSILEEKNYQDFLSNTDYLLTQTNSYQTIIDLLELQRYLLYQKIFIKKEKGVNIYKNYTRNLIMQANYNAITDLKKSIINLNSAIEFINDKKSEDTDYLMPDLANAYHLLGLSYLELGNLDKAIYNLNKCLSLINKNDNLYSDALSVLIRIYLLQNDKTNFLKSFKVYKSLVQDYFSEDNIKLAFMNFNISVDLQFKSEYDKAIHHLDLSENYLINNFEINKNNYQNEIYKVGGNLDLLIDIYQRRLELFYVDYVKYKKGIINSATSLIAITDGIRRHQTEEASKLIFKEKINTTYQLIIELLIKLNEKELALQLIENYKSSLLEDEYKNESNHKLLLDFHYEVKNLVANKSYDKIGFKKALSYLPEILKLLNKKENSIKSESESVSYDKIMINPKHNHAYVNYYIIENTIFAFIVNKNIELKTWKVDANLKAIVAEYRENILNKDELCLSNVLYEALVKPLGKLPINVTFIPHSYLNYLPFETLVMNDIKNGKAYDKFEYLIKHHNIDYQYSMGMSTLMSNKKSKTDKNHLYVPSFSNDKESSLERTIDLSPLIFAKKEVKTIHGLMKSKVFYNSKANKNNFLLSLKDASILHFAGHAIIDEEDHNLSYLAFSAKEGDEDKLYLRELVGNNSNANMIVLSACQTGFGKYGEGEGLLSLGRALVACGSKSIVTSLWNVNDVTGTTIITSFYNNLKSGQAKSEALRNAKKDYLLNPISKTYMHPFYWSAFVFIGDDSALKIETDNSIIYYSIGLLLLLILCITYFFKRRKRNFN